MLLSVKYEPGYNVGSSLGRKVCVSLHRSSVFVRATDRVRFTWVPGPRCKIRFHVRPDWNWW